MEKTSPLPAMMSFVLSDQQLTVPGDKVNRRLTVGSFADLMLKTAACTSFETWYSSTLECDITTIIPSSTGTSLGSHTHRTLRTPL